MKYSSKDYFTHLYIRQVVFFTVFITIYSLSFSQKKSGEWKAPALKTYSILSETGKYTICFGQLSKDYNSSLSTQIAKNIFTLDSSVVTNKIFDNEKFYSLIYQKKKLGTAQLKKLSAFLNLMEAYVFKYTAKVIQDTAKLKGIRKFNIKVDTAETDLVEPDEGTHVLVFPTSIIKNIFNISVSSIFNEDYIKDSLIIRNSENNSFDIISQDSYINGHQPYFEWIKFNERFIPPCLPVFRKEDFLEILNNKTFIRKNLTDREKLEYDELKKIIDKPEFKTQLLLPGASTEEVDCFYVLMSWSILIKYLKTW